MVKKATAAVLTSVMLLSAFPAANVSAATNGWKKKNGEWYYYKNGTKVKSAWLTIYSGGKTKKYAMDSKGRMCTSKNHKNGLMINGSVYFFTKSGGLQKKKWKKIKKDGVTYYYYLSKSGPAYKGKKKIDKKYYYFDETYSFLYTSQVAKKVSGGSYINAGTKKYFYFMNKDGSLKTEKWTKITLSDDSTGTSYTYHFYVGKSGTPYSGWKKIDGNWYYFDTQLYRARVEGTSKMIDGEYYSFDANGVCLNK